MALVHLQLAHLQMVLLVVRVAVLMALLVVAIFNVAHRDKLMFLDSAFLMAKSIVTVLLVLVFAALGNVY